MAELPFEVTTPLIVPSSFKVTSEMSFPCGKATYATPFAMNEVIVASASNAASVKSRHVRGALDILDSYVATSVALITAPLVHTIRNLP